MKTRVLLVLAAMLVLAGTAASATGTGTITTVVGTGVSGSSGDGGPATAAEIVHPRGIALAPGGGFAFADAFGNTVRRVWPDGSITTVAGTGTAGFSGDGGPGTTAQLNLPHGVAFLSDGTLLIVDALNNRVRAVSQQGSISTVAGTGTAGFAGDGGPATEAQLNTPRGIASLPGGGYLIADSDNDRIRRVVPDGTISTVAGGAVRGFSGDGGPALAAELDKPFGVAPTFDGGFLIADAANDRIRKVNAGGTIETVAGNGVRTYGGDGGPATAASINGPHNIAALPDGGFLIADEGNNRVRRVWPDGTITTVVGTGEAGFSGDGGPADRALLNEPKALAVLPNDQGFLLADAANSRIRLVSVDLRPVLALRLRTRALRSRTGTPVTLTFDVSAAATVRLEIRSGSRLVTRTAVKAKRGRNALRFGAGLRPGRYSLVVRATAVLMRPAEATGSLVVARRR